jgi:hypothetical protein
MRVHETSSFHGPERGGAKTEQRRLSVGRIEQLFGGYPRPAERP